jgi:RHS repeat-associated protein
MGCLKLTYRENLTPLKVVHGVFETSGKAGAGVYRYGFNGMEKDDEVKGSGSHYTSLWRLYDPRLGRWFSVDPKSTPGESPFVSMGDNPILNIDPNGDYFFGLFGSTSQERRADRAEDFAAATGGFVSTNRKGKPIVIVSNFKSIEGGYELSYASHSNFGDFSSWKNFKETALGFDKAMEGGHDGMNSGYMTEKEAAITNDVLAIGGSGLAILLAAPSGGTSLALTVSLGVPTIGLTTGKLILDINGEHEKSKKIPSGVGDALGQGFGQVAGSQELGGAIGGLSEGVFTGGRSILKAKSTFSIGTPVEKIATLDDAFQIGIGVKDVADKVNKFE